MSARDALLHDDTTACTYSAMGAAYGEWAELYGLYAALGDDERRVLIRIARRLNLGRRQYGQLVLKTDRRNFRREAQDEALDLAVYLAALLEAP